MKYGKSCFEFCYEYSIGDWYFYKNSNEKWFEFTQKDIFILNSLNCIYDATNGGLVLGKLHRNGGIHLLKPLGNQKYRYVAEMEGWEYLSKSLKSKEQLNNFEEINDRIKPFWRNYSFRIPFDCKIIDTTNSKIAFLILSDKDHCVINRAATKKYIEEIIKLDLL